MERFGVGIKAHIQPRGISGKDTGEIQLLHLFLKPTGKSRIHTGTSGEYDVFVQFRADIDSSILDGLEERFW